MTNQKTNRSSLLSVAQCAEERDQTHGHTSNDEHPGNDREDRIHGDMVAKGASAPAPTNPADERHDGEEAEAEAESEDHAATLTGDENREGVRQLTSTSSTSLSLPNVSGRDEDDRPEYGLGNHAEEGQPANGEENAPVHGEIGNHHQDGYRNRSPRSQDEKDHNERIEHGERDPKPSHGHRKPGVNVEPAGHQIDSMRDRSDGEADNPHSDDQSGSGGDLHAASVCAVEATPDHVKRELLGNPGGALAGPVAAGNGHEKLIAQANEFRGSGERVSGLRRTVRRSDYRAGRRSCCRGRGRQSDRQHSKY